MGLKGQNANQAVEAMIGQFVRSVLRRPETLSGDLGPLLEQIRELSRARTVMVFQCLPAEGGKNISRLVAQAGEAAQVANAMEIVNDLSGPAVWNDGWPGEEIEILLKGMGYKRSVSLPLRAGSVRVGALLILGVTDDPHVKALIEIQEPLSTLVTLVLQNAFLLEQQNQREAAHEKLEEELVKYQNLIDLMSDWVWEFDENGRFTYVGARVRQITGYDAGELLGKTSVDFLCPEDVPQGRVNLRQIIASQKSFSGLRRKYRHKDGHAVFFEVSGIPLFRKDGTFCGYRGITSDITTAKRTENRTAQLGALKEQLLHPGRLLEKLKLITEGIVKIFGADFARIWMTQAGDLCEKGCPHAAVIDGKNLCPDRTRCLHLAASSGRYTDLKGGHRRVPMGAFKIGRVATGENAKFVTNNVTNDPQVHNHEWARSLGLVSFAGFRLLSPEKKPIGVLALFSKSPITDEEVALLEDMANTASHVIQAGMVEETLRKSEAMMSGILNSIPQGIFWKDRNSVYLGGNEVFARAAGLSRPDQIAGKTDFDLPWPREEAQVYRADDREVIRTGQPRLHIVEPLQWADGTRHWVDTTKILLFDGEGQVYGVLGAFEDITERKKIQEALEREKVFTDALFDTVPGILYLFDPQFHLVRWNKKLEEILGYSVQELPKMDILDFFVPEDKPQVGQAVQKIFQEGYGFVEAFMLKKNGQRVPFYLTGGCLKIDDKVYFIGMGIDITERKRSEKAVKASEEKFRILFEAASDAIFLLKGDHFVDCNARALQMFACTREQMVNQNPGNISPPFQPDGRESMEKSMEKITAALRGEPQSFEWKHIRSDGTLFDTEVSLNCIEVGGEKIIQGIVRDITDRKRAEEAVRASEEKYRTLFDAASDGIFITDKKHLLDCNNRTLQIYGCTREQLLGQPPARFLPPRQPDGRDSKEKALEQLAAAFRGEPNCIEWKQYHYDGTTFDSEVSLTCIEIGGEKIIQGIVRDITDRKRAEEQLRESEGIFRAIFSQSFHFIGLLTLDGTILKVNSSALDFAGIKEEDVEGKPFWEGPWWSHSKEEQIRLRDAIKKAAQGEFFRGEATHPDAEGNLHYIDFSIKPVKDENGKVILLIPEGRDITEHKQAEEEIRKLNSDLERRVTERTAQLQAVNKELEAFSYSVSHDLRAPLRSISGFSQLLEEECGGNLPGQAKDYLGRVQKGCRRMAQMIDDFLNLSRVARNEMHRTKVDLSALAGSVVEDLRKGTPEREVHVLIAPDLKGFADKNLMLIVLDNLLGNSWKFTRKQPHPEIEMGLTRLEGEDVFFVRDNGAGFDMAYVEKLFNCFQRFHTEDEFEGTGIGLATVQRIIRRHGGRVWGQGEVNKGATFYFTLPSG
jgi:PAS domain S-box-containing protein